MSVAAGDGPAASEDRRGAAPISCLPGSKTSGSAGGIGRAIPVHPAGRQHRRHLRLGAQSRGRLKNVPLLSRVNSRPAAARARDRSDHRPRDRGAARAHGRPDRQHPLRCIRPTPGIDDLRGAEPVPCRHGGGARVLAEPGNLEPDLCQHQRRLGQRHAVDQAAGRYSARQGAGYEQQHAATHRRADRRRHGAQPGQQRAGQHRPRRHLDRRRGQHRHTKPWCRSPPSPISSPGNTPLAVNHQNLFVASTISFNLAPGVSLSQATAAIDDQMRQLRRAGVDPRQLPGHRQSFSDNRSPTSRS